MKSNPFGTDDEFKIYIWEQRVKQICCLLLLGAIFALCLWTPAEGQTLTRNGHLVTMAQSNGFSMTFHGLYGGAPLSWYQNGVLVTEDFGGEGVQIVFDSGQDGTQSTATGLDYYPISQINRPETYKYSYFGMEEIAEVKNGVATYQTTSFLPYFWVSLEWIDDAIPTNPVNWQNRWSTEYNDILKLGKPGYETFGAPIYFVGTAQYPSGIILLGDEIKATYFPATPWYGRINSIPGGRFALRTRISMQSAGSDAIAAVLLRKKLTGVTTMDQVFNAKGSHLNINRQGVVQLIHNGKLVWTAPQQYWAKHKASLEKASGMEIEIRTHNWDSNSMHLYFDGVLEAVVSNPIEGEGFGLLGIGTTGYIKFLNRNFIDVGTKCTANWKSTSRGTVISALTLSRVTNPSPISMYRVNLPVAFTRLGLRETKYVWNQNWARFGSSDLATQFPAGWIPYVSSGWMSKAMWSGKTDGSLGVFVKPVTPLSTTGHFVIAPSVQGHSTLPYSANLSPVPFTTTTLKLELAPTLRTDLLHD